jgi:hypothetical protein
VESSDSVLPASQQTSAGKYKKKRISQIFMEMRGQDFSLSTWRKKETTDIMSWDAVQRSPLVPRQCNETGYKRRYRNRRVTVSGAQYGGREWGSKR